ncbi:MAG: hypothetical protein M3367_03355, partial [Acidobacteriota bacterium]|nr:hypothetical protein [Acidobacteriota bacterium]
RHPTNNFWWLNDNGTPFNPIGIGDCVLEYPTVGNDLKMTMDGPSVIIINNPNLVRGYSLSSTEIHGAYFHAYTNHTTPTSNITITIDVPKTGTAVWVNPSTGAVLGTQSVSACVQTLNAPPFLIDVVLKIF